MVRLLFATFATLLVTVAGVFAPALAQDAYRLGEGDIVKLTVYQRPDLSSDARLGTNGRIYVPGGGKLDIGGMTIPEAEDQIAQSLKRSGAAPNPQVDLQVVQFASAKVSVFGYVKNTGSFALDRPMRISDLLALAGGILPDGSDHVVLLRKSASGAATQTVVNMKEVLAGNTSADIQVKAGDIVNVPRAPRVYVYGSVNRPGPYILEDGMTPLEMISMAGGLSQTGSDSRLEVVRHSNAGQAQSLKVGLQDKLQPEDVLIVHESIF